MTDSNEFCILTQPRRDVELEPVHGPCPWTLPGGTEAGPLSWGLQSHRLFTNCLFAHWLSYCSQQPPQVGRRALLLARWGQRG